MMRFMMRVGPVQRLAVAMHAILLFTLAPVALAAPNILIIFADDLGVETLASYGGKSYSTPALDQLAAQGLRFENAHATPLCTPSRVMLLTGMDSWRNYTDFAYLAPGEQTFAHMLQRAGYRTMAAGKWQLVSNKYQSLQGMSPAAAGFDEYALWQIVARDDETDRYWGPTIEVSGELVEHGTNQYGPDLFSSALTEFITQSSAMGQPFLAYYPMVLPHRPFAATPDHRDSGDNQENFAAMVAYMDGIVGRLLSTLERSGVADNTLVLFIGDNGTDRKISSIRAGSPTAGGKALTLQSSTHVPFIVRWPGVVAAGSVSDALVYLADVFPTLAEISATPEGPPSGARDPDIDGQSLLPLLTGDGAENWQRDSLFMHYDPRWSDLVPARYAFDRRWKLYEGGRMFDIQSDKLEQHALDMAALSAPASEARQRLQRRLDRAGGALSGILSPQSQYRRDRDRRRTLIGLSLVVLAGLWYRRRRYRESTIS